MVFIWRLWFVSLCAMKQQQQQQQQQQQRRRILLLVPPLPQSNFYHPKSGLVWLVYFCQTFGDEKMGKRQVLASPWKWRLSKKREKASCSSGVHFFKLNLFLTVSNQFPPHWCAIWRLKVIHKTYARCAELPKIRGKKMAFLLPPIQSSQRPNLKLKTGKKQVSGV